MPKITSADCVKAIVAEFNKDPLSNDIMTSLDAYMWEGDLSDNQQNNESVKFARNPKHWKRLKKFSFSANSIPESEDFFLNEDFAPMTVETVGEVIPRIQKNYDPTGGKIIMRWFECFDDDEDDPTDAHWHARVYEQDGRIIQVSIYGEG